MKSRQTHPQERYLCVILLSADGFPHTGERGVGIQFNTKNLEEIAWEGVIKMSHTPSLISPARAMPPYTAQNTNQGTERDYTRSNSNL